MTLNWQLLSLVNTFRLSIRNNFLLFTIDVSPRRNSHTTTDLIMTKLETRGSSPT